MATSCCALFQAPARLSKYCMRYFEFSTSPKKPLNPAQARIASLKRNADIAKNALQAEKKAQQIAKAQQRIQQLSRNKVAV